MISKPFYRTVRQLDNGSYANAGRAQYINRDDYAVNPLSDIRAYLILQNEYVTLLEYIEPADKNEGVYSLRIRDLLIRICTEVESNLKAIIRANQYSTPENMWKMADYQRVEKSHFLSRYEIISPVWGGSNNVHVPYAEWASMGQQALPWYTAYNKCKHDRGTNLSEATFSHLTDAISGLLILLSAQYYTETMTGSNYLIAETGSDSYEYGIGQYFKIKFPTIPREERYSFPYENPNLSNFFQKFDYDSVHL